MGIYIHTITHISGRMSDKMSEIECQNMCQIELQIEIQNMCQIECQNICQVECQNICQDVCHGGDHTKLSNVFSIDSSSKQSQANETTCQPISESRDGGQPLYTLDKKSMFEGATFHSPSCFR